MEGLKDVAFALAPATRGEIEEMLEKTWAGRKLRGFRSLTPADREAVIEVLTRLCQLAADFAQVAEMAINPFRVVRVGAVAWDERVRVAAVEGGWRGSRGGVEGQSRGSREAVEGE